MNAPTVLIVDDDSELQGMLQRLLTREQWSVRSVGTLADASRLLAQHLPDLVVLDLMLPDGNGLDACRRWRVSHPELRILMLSARGDTVDRVLGLEVGADDYLPKPFEARELVARLRALLRRYRPSAAGDAQVPGELVRDDMVIDMLHCRVRVFGRAVDLTAIEYKLLVAMAQVPGQACSREQLSAAAQPGRYRPQDRTVDVQVGRLRRKLQSAAPEREWIVTVRGQGYAFDAGRAA